MIPWPIGIVAAIYAAVATVSAFTVVHGGPGIEWWAAFWCVTSLAVVAGLTWLKPWARRLGAWLAVLLMLGTLLSGVAALAQTPPQPMRCLAATGLASAYLVLARYLTRPHVKVWFEPKS